MAEGDKKGNILVQILVGVSVPVVSAGILAVLGLSNRPPATSPPTGTTEPQKTSFASAPATTASSPKGSARNTWRSARNTWRHSQGFFEHTKGNEWLENINGKIKIWTEIQRTGEYIEIVWNGPKLIHHIRLFKDRALRRPEKDKDWTTAFVGKWDS